MIDRTLKYTINPDWNGRTIEQFLRFHGYSKRTIIKLKQNPVGILLNNRHARTIDPINLGDTLSITLNDGDSFINHSQNNNSTFKFALKDGLSIQSNCEKHAEFHKYSVGILYEDDDIIVFNKPPAMPCHQSKGHLDDALSCIYFQHFDPPFRALNRLDRDTSGIVVACKNRHTAALLKNKVSKTYYAVICKNIPEKAGTIDLPIARKEDGKILRRVDPEFGQKAITQYKVIAQEENYTALEIHLLTGRTHQIRVHFSHIGFPLAGDRLYGGDCSVINRQALHCGKAFFSNPITGKEIRVFAPFPADILRFQSLTSYKLST